MQLCKAIIVVAVQSNCPNEYDYTVASRAKLAWDDS